jgi:hypothetical protein
MEHCLYKINYHENLSTDCESTERQSVADRTGTLHGKKPEGQVEVGDEFSARQQSEQPTDRREVYINGNNSTESSETESTIFQLAIGTNGKV